MKFNIGDKVRVTKDCWSAEKDDEGVIRALPGNNGAKSFAFKIAYAVEFPAWTKTMGHSCGGTVPSGKGQWIEPECLELIKSASAEKIVITHDGKTTTAKLYDGKEITKTAEAKCSPDDKFDFAAGAKLAFERLMGVEKKEPPKFDKSMLTTGLFGYMSDGQGWFVVVNGNLVYEKGGYDVIAKIDENGAFSIWRVECIVDALSFANAKIRLLKGKNIVWMRPGFDPKKAV